MAGARRNLIGARHGGDETAREDRSARFTGYYASARANSRCSGVGALILPLTTRCRQPPPPSRAPRRDILVSKCVMKAAHDSGDGRARPASGRRGVWCHEFGGAAVQRSSPFKTASGPTRRGMPTTRMLGGPI